MGYYTTFILTVDPAPTEDLISTLTENQSEYIGAFEFYSTVSRNSFYLDECKWYEHVEDMKVLSSTYPEYVFTLHGRGEEQGDEWVEFYKNGKTYKVILVMPIPSFHEEFLK